MNLYLVREVAHMLAPEKFCCCATAPLTLQCVEGAIWSHGDDVMSQVVEIRVCYLAQMGIFDQRPQGG